LSKKLETEKRFLLAKIRLDRLIMQEKYIAGPAAGRNGKMPALWTEYGTEILEKAIRNPLWIGGAAVVIMLLPRHTIGNTLRYGTNIVRGVLGQPEGFSLGARAISPLLPALLGLLQSMRSRNQKQKEAM
jgi:hypothetical protein